MITDFENGWHEWSKYVLKELERLDTNDKEIIKKLGDVADQVLILKIKSSIYGGIAGFIIAILVQLILPHMKI